MSHHGNEHFYESKREAENEIPRPDTRPMNLKMPGHFKKRAQELKNSLKKEGVKKSLAKHK